jgi:predicted TIM-barrel fold metal-dependent hydrolase
VVHVHPTAANCCRNLEYAPGVAPGSLEYGTDTTRAITGVAFSGDAARFPDIRFIWSHAGGTAPFLASRIDGASRGAKERHAGRLHGHAEDRLLRPGRRYNAGARWRRCCSSCRRERVLFGTDSRPAAPRRTT